ncbi:hypothetical protein [Mucilaginibacter corticis]|nr:hypothetical protein [Mucilaginibacter corticis]
MILLTIAYLCKRYNVLARVYSMVFITKIPAVTLAACLAYQPVKSI